MYRIIDRGLALVMGLAILWSILSLTLSAQTSTHELKQLDHRAETMITTLYTDSNMNEITRLLHKREIPGLIAFFQSHAERAAGMSLTFNGQRIFDEERPSGNYGYASGAFMADGQELVVELWIEERRG